MDLSHIRPTRLPSPFTPPGKRPTGPAWYATPTVAYAVEFGADVAAIEAYLRYETDPYLAPWHDRLKDACVSLMADAGIPVDKDTDERRFLAAHKVFKSSQGDLAKVTVQGEEDGFVVLRHLLLHGVGGAGPAYGVFPAQRKAGRCPQGPVSAAGRR